MKNSRPEIFCKKVFLKVSQNLQEKTCARVFFLIKFRADSRGLVKTAQQNLTKFVIYFFSPLAWILRYLSLKSCLRQNIEVFQILEDENCF